METSKVRYVCLFLSVTILLAHWNLILFCFSLKQRTFNAFPLTLDERYEIQQLILGRKVYSIFAWWSSSNIRSLFLFLWFQVISFYSATCLHCPKSPLPTESDHMTLLLPLLTKISHCWLLENLLLQFVHSAP